MKRSLDSPSTSTKDLYDGLLTARDALPLSLKGLNVACAGPLIFAEDAKYTFHLGPTVLAEIVEAREGAFAGTINGKTDIVVVGMLEKEWTQKQDVRQSDTRPPEQSPVPPRERLLRASLPWPIVRA
jgi:hypothetical protein